MILAIAFTIYLTGFIITFLIMIHKLPRSDPYYADRPDSDYYLSVFFTAMSWPIFIRAWEVAHKSDKADKAQKERKTK